MKTLERTYDGIIIGAGHHGLILGAYLAKAGLDILLVERRLTYGGGLATREVTLPGFYHNLHSINHFHITETPWFKDLGLDARVDYITPRYEFGQAHDDGTALVLGRDLEETIANIARFSRRDAAAFREWNRKAEKITAQIFLPERYAEPLPQAEREALRASGMLVITMRDIDEMGVAAAARLALDRFGRLPRLHVSLDMDALDPDEAPGVGTPVPGGLSYREAHLLMEILADSSRVGSLDIVEVNPILDDRNRTARLSVELAASLLGKRIF